jgi:hypothetical protein
LGTAAMRKSVESVERSEEEEKMSGPKRVGKWVF